MTADATDTGWPVHGQRLEAALAGVPAGKTAAAVIDLAALTANYRDLAERAAPAECAAVVKANGYGLGLLPVAEALFGAGARTFFVAAPDEAFELRSALPEATVYLLNGLLPGTEKDLTALDIRPVLNSLGQIEQWTSAASRAGRDHTPPSAIHFDTAMNRLGLGPDETARLAEKPEQAAAAGASLYMSHFACADEPHHPLNEAQRNRFLAGVKTLPQARLSLANSAGTIAHPASHLDLVRPGIAVYGGRAVEDLANPMRPVLRLMTRILQVRTASAGETVGYGATQSLAAPARLATLAIGYADGYLRHLSARDGHPGGWARIAGYDAPLVGRVSMDLVVVDVSGIPEPLVRPGAFAEVIGPEVGLDHLADRSGTIGYELLTRVGRRPERVYLSPTETTTA